MKTPDTGEQAYALTDPMVQALDDLSRATQATHFIPNTGTAMALLHRGFVVIALDNEQSRARVLYRLTDRGRAALIIGRRQRGMRAERVAG